MTFSVGPIEGHSGQFVYLCDMYPIDGAHLIQSSQSAGALFFLSLWSNLAELNSPQDAFRKLVGNSIQRNGTNFVLHFAPSCMIRQDP